MDLDMIVFGDYTLKQVLMVGGGVVAAFIVFSFIKKLFAKPKASEYSQKARCKSCGWSGMVSKYAGKCPQCNAPLGDRSAK